jgi:hypothetical protein
MSPTGQRISKLPEHDPRLLLAAQAYLAELEGGGRPDRRAFASRYPDLAAELEPYLATLDLFHSPAATLPFGLHPPAREEALAAEPPGDFRILREIGRGGMGTVYDAVQTSLGRLHQIALQLQGPRAFREPEVAAALKLTAQQSERIRAVVAETFTNGPHGPRGPGGASGSRHGPGGSSEKSHNERDRDMQAARARILALLTPEQTQRWQEITGAPYGGRVPPGPYCSPP